MARLSATFVLLSIAFAARGMPAPDGHDTKSDSTNTMLHQPEKKVYWGGANCVNSCRSSWGWIGHAFGDDPWGKVMSSGDPVPTTSLPSEAAFTVNPLAPSVPISTSAFVTSLTSFSNSSSTSSSTSSTVAPTTSASTEATVRIFNAPPNTGLTRPPKPTTTPTPEPKTQAPQPPAPSPTPAPAPEPKPEPQPAPAPAPEPAPAPPQQDNSGGESGDRAEYLRFHNEARAQHSANPVTYSLELENFAQEWADNCVFEHSGGKFGRIGENLAAGTGAYSIESMVNDWVVEVKDYNPNNPKPSHFTQVVWKETTEIGCAKQTCRGIFGNTPATYYVCEYRPAGNVIGRFAAQVQK